MERNPRFWRSEPPVEYGEPCARCATELPAAATVCTVCGLTLTIPVQLPAPREALAA